MPLRRPGTTAALRRDRHLAEALDRSEDAWSGAGFNGAVSADLQGLVCRIPDLAGRCCGVRGGGAQRDRVGQQVQDGQQLGDLLIGGGGGELQAEADLLAGHARVEGQGGVDAVVQQEAAGPWQVVGGLRAAPR